MRRWLLAWAVLGGMLGASAALAQTSPPEPIYGTGAEPPSAEDIEGVPVISLTRAYIPEAISLVDRFPEPGNQGKTGTCVAWATGYAARSYYNALLAGSPNRPDVSQIASPAYLHNLMFWHIKGEAQGLTCDRKGWAISRALDALRGHGTLAHQDYDFSNVCNPLLRIDENRAARNKISGRMLVAVRPSLHSALTRVVLDKVRQQLAAGHPVIFGMQIGDTFMRLRPGAIYSDTMAETREAKRGGHAMVVVGYDDRRQAFYVINSWGRDWAEAGFGWISYNSFLADVTDAWVMNVAGVKPPTPAPGRPPDPSSVLPPQIASLSCADVRTERADTSGEGRGALRYSGFVGSFEDKRKVDAIARGEGRESALVVRPWPVCEAMLTLKEPLRAASTPGISISGGQLLASDVTSLKVGETFSIRITAPNVPAFMYAFYIEDDGTVVNLIPRRGPIRKQTMPGEQVVIGDGQHGRATFRVTPLKSPLPRGDAMRGHEAVVVVAARAPLQDLEDQERPDSPVYRVAAKSGNDSGPPDRLLLSLLRDITQQRVEADKLPREVSAAVVQIKIEE